MTTQVYVDKKAHFTLKPKFLEVVRCLPSADPKQTVFSYEEVREGELELTSTM